MYMEDFISETVICIIQSLVCILFSKFPAYYLTQCYTRCEWVRMHDLTIFTSNHN